MSPRPLLLSLTLFCAGCATAPPTPDAQEVDAFSIEGEQQLKEGDLKEKVVTNESSWLPSWVPWLGHLEWFDPIAWQADLRRIQRFYEANGYYQARVVEDVVTETKPKHVKLLVRLREGDPARVTSVNVVGLEALPPDMSRGVLEELPLNVGDIFLEDSWQQTKALLASRLRELGFAEVALSGEALVDVDGAKVDCALTVVLGTRYKFGKTFVATDPGAQVPPRLIADVASPDLVPGEYFSESAMADAQARVFQMGVFAGAKVNRGAPDREAGTVPVVIDVREAPFRSVRMGGGLGGDLVRQELRAIFEYTNRNVGFSRLFLKDSRLDRLTLKAKLGIAVLPNVVEVFRSAPLSKWGPVWRVYTEYEVPRVFELRTLSFQGSVDLLRTLDNTYSYDALEGKVGFVWRPFTDVTIFPSLNLNGFLLYAPLELRDTAPAGAMNCPVFPNACIVSFLDVTAELDERDNKLEPKAGYYLSLDVAGGLSSTSRLRPFFKVTPEVRGYVSFGKKKQFTLAGRGKFGLLLAPENDTPIVVRYFSGGSNMRGFYNRRLSPQIAVPTLVSQEAPRCAGQADCPKVQLPDFTKGTTLPLGGAGLLEASVELRWAVSEDWILAIFNDWGLVTEQPIGATTDWASSLYTAVGFGVRYRTPLGPIRVDIGVRLPFFGAAQRVSNLAGTDNGEVKAVQSSPGCFFGVGSGLPVSDPYTYGATPGAYGGAPDNICSAHLSIGEAF